MTRSFSLVLAALLVAVMQLTASTHASADRWGRGAGVAIGVGAGLAALYIITESARAEGYRRGPRCRALINRCDDGERWACRRFNERCR